MVDGPAVDERHAWLLQAVGSKVVVGCLLSGSLEARKARIRAARRVAWTRRVPGFDTSGASRVVDAGYQLCPLLERMLTSVIAWLCAAGVDTQWGISRSTSEGG